MLQYTNIIIIVKTNGNTQQSTQPNPDQMTFESHLTNSHLSNHSNTYPSSPNAKKVPTLQSMMLLSKQNIDQSTIISSQAAQILLLKEQIDKLRSENGKLRDFAQEMKLKYEGCKAVGDKVQVVKDSLTADFNMLKNVITHGEKQRKYMQKQNTMLKLELQQKQQSIQNLQQQIRTFQRECLSLTHHFQSQQKSNNDLHAEIRALKLLNIQSKLSHLSMQDKQNCHSGCLHLKNNGNKNSGSKTVKKKNQRKSINLSTYVGCFNNANDT